MKTLRQNVLFHEAHFKGMGVYKEYFQNKTDTYIRQMIDKLKELGEFDNKIFIIVADHGMTQMPAGMTYTDPVDGSIQPAEMSCSLRVSGFNRDDIQEAEKSNNNLHIWELGEMLKAVGKFTRGNFSYRILAPQSIAELFSEEEYGARATLTEANVIAGLNGPMAHIYVKGSDWSTTPDINKVRELAEIFRVTMQGEYITEAINKFGLTEKGYKDLRSTVVRLKFAIDKILVRVNGNYCVFDGSINCTANEFNAQEYVDAWTRINGLNNPDRSGDIILIMKDSTTGTAIDRYTTGVACKSWHGSLNPSDSYVPFIVSYPGGNKTVIKTMLKKDTVCKEDYSECKKNWKLPDIIKEIITEQYK